MIHKVSKKQTIFKSLQIILIFKEMINYKWWSARSICYSIFLEK